MEQHAKTLVKRFEELKAKRDNWNTHYQELADYMLPRKADIVKKRSRETHGTDLRWHSFTGC